MFSKTTMEDDEYANANSNDVFISGNVCYTSGHLYPSYSKSLSTEGSAERISRERLISMATAPRVSPHHLFE